MVREVGRAPLRADSAKVASITRDVVNNAIKFTEQGRVTAHIDYDRRSRTYRDAAESAACRR
jgi:hypothetical protein